MYLNIYTVMYKTYYQSWSLLIQKIYSQKRKSEYLMRKMWTKIFWIWNNIFTLSKYKIDIIFIYSSLTIIYIPVRQRSFMEYLLEIIK